jgi:uncharacterized damage-inducible protein DinB
VEEKTLRQNLLEFLEKGAAHAILKDVLTGIKPENYHNRPNSSLHTIWEELEHIRLAQEDILRYTLDPDWQSPPWPSGYWPDSDHIPDAAQFDQSISALMSDLDEVKDLINNEKIDLTACIPHGEWRTYLREILLIIDHNAYHMAKIVQLRKLLDNWPS